MKASASKRATRPPMWNELREFFVNDAPQLRPVFVDAETGHTGAEEHGFTLWWWSEGNGSCDCNRHYAVYGHDTDDDDTGFCRRALKLVAVDFLGEHEKHPKKALLLAEINKAYEPSVIAMARARWVKP